MSEPFIGEIQLFGFNFNPYGWAFCNGGTLPISQNTALFSLLGTQYGGNGQTTFQLPNFAGRAGCQQGQGPGLSPRQIGEPFGTADVTLTSTQVPAHSHGVRAWSQTAPGSGSHAPVSNGGLSFLASSTTSRTYGAAPLDTQMAPNMLVPNSGGGAPHQNRQPYLGVNFCIALQGIFPSFP
ncbi:phage tail protein [Luteimonas kalidii]|uniref:Tail fiber protein n=1 Tax=Luteimonas kalidii TaxID=3042025 RepID=A0ABT6JRR0_9GAMM|nr:tail fiber protein [Luteimonas kalidii]MDH5833378.1 tail fiber protein [Luteimonas kalidii]